MKSTTLEPTAVPRDRIAHGYRWEDNKWKEEPPLPDGAFGAMGGMLTSLDDLGRYSRRVSRCVASSRWARDRPGQPRIVTGNAADLAIATGNGGAHIGGDATAECGRLRLWPPGGSNL